MTTKEARKAIRETKSVYVHVHCLGDNAGMPCETTSVQITKSAALEICREADKEGDGKVIASAIKQGDRVWSFYFG